MTSTNSFDIEMRRLMVTAVGAPVVHQLAFDDVEVTRRARR